MAKRVLFVAFQVQVVMESSAQGAELCSESLQGTDAPISDPDVHVAPAAQHGTELCYQETWYVEVPNLKVEANRLLA